jgi:hypothetical protein
MGLSLGELPEIEDEEGFARIMGYDAHRATLQGCAAGAKSCLASSVYPVICRREKGERSEGKEFTG